jgi:tetratricopeptide (TPR) repeat protein
METDSKENIDYLSLNKLTSLALQARIAGDYEQAIEYFNQAYAIAPSVYTAYYRQVGQTYSQMGDYEKAIEYYKKCELPANCEIGDAYLFMGNYEQAIEFYEKEISTNSDFWNYGELGQCYFKTNRFEKAIDCFQKAIEMDPDDDVSYHNMGVAYEKIGKSRESTACYEKATNINPKEFVIIELQSVRNTRSGEENWVAKANPLEWTELGAISMSTFTEHICEKTKTFVFAGIFEKYLVYLLYKRKSITIDTANSSFVQFEGEMLPMISELSDYGAYEEFCQLPNKCQNCQLVSPRCKKCEHMSCCLECEYRGNCNR